MSDDQNDMLEELDWECGYRMIRGEDPSDTQVVKARIVEAVTILHTADEIGTPQEVEKAEQMVLVMLAAETDTPKLVLTLLGMLQVQMEALKDTPRELGLRVMSGVSMKFEVAWWIGPVLLGIVTTLLMLSVFAVNEMLKFSKGGRIKPSREVWVNAQDRPHSPWMIRIAMDRGLSYEQARRAMLDCYSYIDTTDKVLLLSAWDVGVVMSKLDEIVDHFQERTH